MDRFKNFVNKKVVISFRGGGELHSVFLLSITDRVALIIREETREQKIIPLSSIREISLPGVKMNTEEEEMEKFAEEEDG